MAESGQSDRIPRTYEYADCPLCGETIYNSGAAWGGHMFVTHEYRAAAPPEPPLDVDRLGDAEFMGLASMVHHQMEVRGLAAPPEPPRPDVTWDNCDQSACKCHWPSICDRCGCTHNEDVPERLEVP